MKGVLGAGPLLVRPRADSPPLVLRSRSSRPACTTQLALFVALAGSVVSGFAAKAADPVIVDRVIAVVNDQIILRSDLDKELGLDPRVLELKKQPAAAAAAQRDKIRNELLQRLIDRDLVLSEARRFGLEVGPADERRALQSLAKENGFASIKELEAAVLASGSFESWEAYLVDLRRSILEAQVLQYLAPGRVTEAQVREFYRKMSRGEDARVRVIRLEYRAASDSPNERDVAYQRAQAATKRLRTGADPSTIDDDSQDGPTEFEVGRGDIQPVLEDRIFAAKEGQIVGPVSTGRGYVVLKVLEQMDADVLPFEEAKDRIRQQLEFEAQMKAREELMEKLRSRAHLDIRI